jgi:hypothetical protein
LNIEPLERRELLAVVGWADWVQGVAGTDGSATGVMTFEEESVAVTYTGEIAFIQTAGGTNYWSPPSPYVSSVVTNPPPPSDIIALSQATSKTLTFSKPVADLLFAVVSLNGNGYRFDHDFDILSYGAGYWGNGTFSKQVNSDGTYQLNGSGEPHGVIRFKGAHSSITWTSLTNEYWNGFTVGAVSLAQSDLTLSASVPQFFAPGIANDISWTVNNDGTVPASADWLDGVYLSTDATLSGDDLLLASESAAAQTPLNQGTAYSITRAITLPVGTAAGSYHVLVVTDGDNAQLESNESNNLVAVPITVDASPPEVLTMGLLAECMPTSASS